MSTNYVQVNSAGTFWYKDPEMTIIHRQHSHAAESPSGDKFWLIDGKFHREDGPAVEYVNGDVQYWLDNVEMTKEQWEQALAEKKS